MPIGKNSINRVAEGLNGLNAAPLTADFPTAEAPSVEAPAVDTPATEVEKKIVEATKEAPLAPEAGETVATAVEKKTVKSTAKKAVKKSAAKKVKEKPAEVKAEEKTEEEKKAPELIGQAVAAPKKRGRKPGSKNKPKVESVPAPVIVKASRKPSSKSAVFAVAIGEELPVYLL